MKNRSGLILAVLIAGVLAAAGATFAAADQAASPAPAASGYVVTIANNAFTPESLTVPVGATVTWKNQDSYAHTVTAQAKGGFDSGNLDGGKTFTQTFKKAGAFHYVCSYHPKMTGTIIVGQPDGSQATSAPSSY